MIKYQANLKGVTAEKLKGFFVDWPNSPSASVHFRLLKKSAFRILAIDPETGRAVGFITAITDGVLSVYIPFLEVLPEYKGRGIGKELVRRMLLKLKKAYMIDLVCDSDLQKFYKKFNMSPSSAMIKRNYPNQSGGRIC